MKYSVASHITILSLLFTFISFLPVCGQEALIFNNITPSNADSQLLLNGRIWYNLYSRAFGHQFFATTEFLTGDVTLEGKQYKDLNLKYDILNDELLLSVPYKPVLIMNREMVDSFSLNYNNRIYRIVNMDADSGSAIRGYVNVLYNGPTALYVKYMKEIQPLAVDGKYDRIIEKHKIFIKKDTAIVRISGRADLMKQLQDKKREIREFIRKNNYQVGRIDPYTFIPVLEFYDSVKRK